MRRNIIIFVFIAIISLVFGSIIFYFAGLNDKEEVKLSGRINVLVDSDNYESVQEAAANFKKIHSRIEINIIKDTDVNKKITGEIKAGKVKEDVAIVLERYAKPLIKLEDYPFVDVTQEISNMNETFSKGKLDALTENKKIYGFPWTSNPVLIMYRSDIFSSQGINIDDIKTWEDFRTVGKNLTAGTGKKFLIYPSSEFDELNDALLSQLRITHSDKTNTKRVSDLINGMVYEGSLYGADSIITMAKREEALAILITPGDAVKLMGIDALKGKWGIMKVPAFEPGGNRNISLGGYDIVVNKDSKNINLSMGFSKYLSTDSSTAYINLTKYGRFSSAYTIYERATFDYSNDYFDTNIWRVFEDVEKNAPENKY